jgi:uncharacterized protein YecE (DUF72 family)
VSPFGAARTGYLGAMSGRIVVGTSSWADPGFVEEWYPPGLPAAEQLPWYAEHFDGVEVNSTFYAVPAARTVARWAQATPATFTFDVKLHRALSRHSATPASLPADLRDGVALTPRGRVRPSPALDEALAARYLEALEPLREAGRLSAFLLQLSPAFRPGAHRLEELDTLVAALAPHPVAIELRHRAWLKEERLEDTLGWYEDRGAAFVGVDAPHGAPPTLLPPVDAVTRDDVAYLRLHGRNAEGWIHGRSVAERFAYRYADDELQEVGARAEALAERAGTVRMMFNNNRGSDAPVAATRMRELLGQGAGVA